LKTSTKGFLNQWSCATSGYKLQPYGQHIAIVSFIN